MNVAVLIVGLFFAAEGIANIWWWHRHPDVRGELVVWQWGRLLRTMLGIALMFIARGL